MVVFVDGTAQVADQDDVEKALACGLSAGPEKLKDGPADAQYLYKAITVTLTGRDLAKNRELVNRAAIEFGLDIVPLGECFKPIFFPDKAGGGDIGPSGDQCPEEPHFVRTR